MLMKGLTIKYTSLTLAGLTRAREELTDYTGHIIIDDLGSEKSIWSRVSTVTVLATLVHTHNIRKITREEDLTITNFQGSASLNIQPILMNSLIHDEDWIAVVRDKVLRYYHLIRPIKPKSYIPNVNMDMGLDIRQVKEPAKRGRLWYQLIAIGLTQWSYARCLEHIPMMLKACAAIDDRTEVNVVDYRLLIKLMKPMQLERYTITSYGFEEGRNFLNNVYCVLVEIASHKEPTPDIIAEDYKVSPTTVERIITTMPEWCWKKTDTSTKIIPTETCTKILNLVGGNQKW